MKSRALVVLSGGQDSTTCLYWALSRFDGVEAVTFDYGQRHKLELEAAKTIALRADVPQKVIQLPNMANVTSSELLSSGGSVSRETRNGLPATFVPGRNLLFLSYAAAYAYSRGIDDLVAGVCQTDYSGYPDCRRNTIDAMCLALNLGMEGKFQIHTPLMYMTKAESVHLAKEVGAYDALAFSHTCYNGVYPPCGQCAACELRQKGFDEAGLQDPLVMRARSGK